MFSAIKRLRHILTRREQLQVVALLVAIIFMALAQTMGVALVMPFIAVVMEPLLVFENRWLSWVYGTLNFTSEKNFIIFTGVVLFATIFLSNAVSAFVTWFKLRFSGAINHRLSCRLLAKYLAMPYAFFLNQHSSDLSKNVLSEVGALTGSYLNPLLDIITRGLFALSMLIMLLWVNVVISLVVLVFIGGAYLAIYWRVNKNLQHRGAKRFKANKMRFKAADEAFGGIKETKVLNREVFFLNSYSRASFKQFRYSTWNAVIQQMPRFALESLAFGGIIIFVIVSLLTLEDARQVIPLAGLFAFAGYRLMPALQELFSSFTKMKFNQAVLDRIYQDITTGETPVIDYEVVRKSLPEPIPFEQEISLDNISYSYPNARCPVISKICLTIKRNSAVALVGPTGAGKTTLADIILGLLPPQEGKLLVDGVPIDQSNVIRWQRNIGYVPQYIYLSDNTVARNIAFGLPDHQIDRKTLEHAARVANIHDFITEELPTGYDTLVGERGIRLSGGQRQRIGIARALYHDPKVLVFDEATSALDGITEEAVLNAMENASKLKTLIIIAHRLTTVKSCDVIYMIEKGKIVGSGTYWELLNSNEQFKAMARSAK